MLVRLHMLTRRSSLDHDKSKPKTSGSLAMLPGVISAAERQPRPSAFADFHLNADSLLSFRVSDAARRRKVFDARTAGVIG